MHKLPDIDFFGAGFVANDLGRHPGDGARERHLGALLVPLATRAEVTDLHNVILRDQHAASESGR